MSILLVAEMITGMKSRSMLVTRVGFRHWPSLGSYSALLNAEFSWAPSSCRSNSLHCSELHCCKEQNITMLHSKGEPSAVQCCSTLGGKSGNMKLWAAIHCSTRIGWSVMSCRSKLESSAILDCLAPSASQNTGHMAVAHKILVNLHVWIYRRCLRA